MITPTILYVKTFGGFSISRQMGKETFTISENDNYSRKIWGLLEYMVVFRKRGVTRAGLIDAFWSDDCSGNPDNNLKALIFRARNTMTALGFTPANEIIVCQGSSYRFNDAFTLHVDTEKFESLCYTAETAGSPAAQLESSLKALSLYDGDFLSKSTDFSWVATLNIYYHSKYLKLCTNAIALLSQAERFDEIIALCKKALTIEPYDEMLHRSLIEAFIASGAMQAAMQHYSYVIDLFISELAVSPSKELTALYHKITSAVRAVERDLYTIRNTIEEHEDIDSPFFCGYATFRDIYRLEARSAGRSEEPVELVMLTLSELQGTNDSRSDPFRYGVS